MKAWKMLKRFKEKKNLATIDSGKCILIKTLECTIQTYSSHPPAPCLLKKINKVNEISFSYSPPLIHEVQKGSQNWKLYIVGAGLDADCIYRSIIAAGSLADSADILPGSMLAAAGLCCREKSLVLNNWSKNWWWRSPPRVPNGIHISGTVPFLLLQSKGGYNYILDLWIVEVWLGFFILI